LVFLYRSLLLSRRVGPLVDKSRNASPISTRDLTCGQEPLELLAFITAIKQQARYELACASAVRFAAPTQSTARGFLNTGTDYHRGK